jgi:hypothetical protein
MHAVSRTSGSVEVHYASRVSGLRSQQPRSVTRQRTRFASQTRTLVRVARLASASHHAARSRSTAARHRPAPLVRQGSMVHPV